jgi:ankyrin repeat protein
MELYVMSGNLDYVKEIVEKVDLRNKTANDIGYLTLALEYNHLDVADFLFENGFEIENPNEDGMTDLHYLVKVGTPEAIKKMISFGADIHRVDSFSENALFHACRESNEESAIVLIEAGSDVNHVNDSNQSIIDLIFKRKLNKLLAYIENNILLLNDENLNKYKSKRMETIF